MPIHDWSRVDAGVFHHFNHGWIEEITRALNSGILPPEYYALAEQHAAGFGPDVLTLREAAGGEPWPNTAPAAGELTHGVSPARPPSSGLRLLTPEAPVRLETDMEFYRRKQHVIAVRHVSGDHLIAVVEIVSRGNKATRHAMQSLVEKAAELLDWRIHVSIVDVHLPGRHDPHGVHAAIWDHIAGESIEPPAGKPFTVVVYETALTVKAYMHPTALGETLSDMPLFLEPGAHVLIPLEATYIRAFAALPNRWRRVLEER